MPTSPPAVAEPQAETRRPTALSRDSMKLRETTNNTWRAVVKRGTSREMLTCSDLWAAVAETLLPFDKISVVDEARTYYAELLCLDSGRGHATIVELSFHPLPMVLAVAGAIPAGFSIDYSGPDRLFVVLRLADSVVMGEGFQTKEDALAYLLDHNSLRG